jgi:hypothetical protein
VWLDRIGTEENYEIRAKIKRYEKLVEKWFKK